ncbi:hypothetical protein UK23_25885 [Lentzea aerocolonigenes]|uniref:Uncharacterized protein n=1 Tax=Lentzea aerocolonigenes TaxID=68170 RepID=A0A0F0GVX9_LENAE|nr:hypothetical protein [Lentzea aerocolonigenes]KJK45573.1 hypothetical protein UK23_25885 [Lentzea aerocolonigenes]
MGLREHVIGDFTPDEHAAIQQVVHSAGTALSELLPVERLYVLSLGSQQAHRTSAGTSRRCRGNRMAN